MMSDNCTAEGCTAPVELEISRSMSPEGRFSEETAYWCVAHYRAKILEFRRERALIIQNQPSKQ